MLVSRRITEKAVLTAVRERLRDPASIRYVLERVEAEVKLRYADLPEETRIKRAALTAEERRIANYIEFIGEGTGRWAKRSARRSRRQASSTPTSAPTSHQLRPCSRHHRSNGSPTD